MITRNNDFIVFGKPNFSDKEIRKVKNILKSGWAGTGLKSKEFENKFIRYKKAKYGIALNSCTSALQIALSLSEVNKGDEVIVTGLTFCSTVNVIENLGAKPIFVDVHLNDLQINETLIENKISKKTKALIIVHMHGYPCSMTKIKKICKKYSIKLIEDCAHAIETKYYNKHTGTFGDFGCFSFYSTKNLTTIEGGMLICKLKKHEKLARMLSLHGMTKDAFKRFSTSKFMHYDVIMPGFKSNMTDLNATIGLEQLKLIEINHLKRKKIWAIYQDAFKSSNFITPLEPENKNIKHAYHLYYLRLKNGNMKKRNLIMEKLNSMGIGTGLHYRGILDLKFYKNKYKNQIRDTPNSILFGRTSFCIPLTPHLKIYQVNKIIESVTKINSIINKL